MAQHLPLLSATEEEAMLEEAGFADVALFYAGFSFRGWVAVAAP
jgi:tRNA (cmo5U34)-methyltransferase